MSDNLDGNHNLVYHGFEELIGDLKDYISKAEKPLEILETGVKEYVNDLKKLTKPYSKIRCSSYTHLVDTFNYRKTNKDIEVGWGKYYGRMVEDGTMSNGIKGKGRHNATKAQPHMYPTFQKNKEKYYKKMLNAFYR